MKAAATVLLALTPAALALRHAPLARRHRCDRSSGPVVLSGATDPQPEQERRLVPKLGDRFFWIDEVFDTKSEREERDRLKRENIAKWGRILSTRDTFDERADPEADSGGGVIQEPGRPDVGLPSEWLVVLGSIPVLVALVGKGVGAW